MAFLGVLALAPMLLLAMILSFLVMCIPIFIGAAIQMLLVLLVKRRWLWLIPPVLGVFGVVWSCFFLQTHFPLFSILLYWGCYYFILCIMWLLASQIKKLMVKKKNSREGKSCP